MTTSKPKKAGALAWAGGLALCAALLLAAIAGPKFLKFQARSQLSEARANLKGLWVAEQAYFNGHGQYASDLTALDYVPERSNRYAYFLEPTGDVIRRDQPTPAPVKAPVGVSNDVVKYSVPLVSTFAQTGCPVTAGTDGAGRQVELGVTDGPQGGFVIVAARQPEEGKRFDCWSIASMERTSHGGEHIPLGSPFQETPDR